jgi:hypothetical protein
MSEHRIRQIVFWAGGVLLPEIGDWAVEALSADGPRGVDASLSVDARFDLHTLARELALGRVDADEFLRRAWARGGGEAARAAAAASLKRSLSVPAPLVVLVGEMADRYRLSLLSDYPAEWLEAILPGTALADVFPPDETWYTADLAAGGDYNHLFAEAVRSGALRPGASLLIDHHSRRTTAALRHGIDTAIYVDVPRLRRDLALWALPPFG